MAKIKTLKVGFGTSIAKNPSTWMKASAEMEIELETSEDIKNKEKIWEDAWNRITEEVSKQLGKFSEE